MQKVADPGIVRIKEKLQEHLIKNDLSLEHLFAFIDKDKSKTITIEEFTRGLQVVLTAEEARALFLNIDNDQNNLLTYEELVTALQQVHTGYVLY